VNTTTCRWFSAFALLLLAGVTLAQDASLQITEVGDNYRLAVPVSRLVMTIPKGKLKQTTNPGSNHPRYFYFIDGTFNLSGWFEPSQRFKGVDDFWSGETASWKRQGLPEAKDTTFSKLDNWQVVIYDMAIPGPANTHIRAHWVQAGTWIDLHLSLTGGTSADNRAKLAAFLQTIQVKEKDK